MKIFFYFLMFFSLVSCSQTKDVQSDHQKKQEEFIASAQMFQRNDLPYQKFNPSVQFLTPKEFPEKTMDVLIQEQQEFIRQSGLPNNANFHEWVSSHTINEALSIYNNYSSNNSKHIYINSFKQYGGWLILTKMNLLSSGTNKNVSEILNSLIQANYKGYGLMYYTLNQLNENNFDKSVISAYAKLIVKNANEDKDNLSDLDLNKLSLRNTQMTTKAPLENLLKNFIENKRKDKTLYLDKIQGLIDTK